LAVGSTLDVIRIDWEYNIKIWTKGVVKEIIASTNHLKVTFENESARFFRDYHKYSMDIAPYNTKTESEDWRFDMKEDDLIDAFDSTKVWYASTIQAREMRTEDGRTFPYVKVGFRLFHPQGNKELDDKRKYFGWSERFDEWLSPFSPRIQRY
jgi:hypothetical protein